MGCTSTCAAGGSCASGGRRLSETEAHARQLSTPQVAVTYVLTFPPGTSTAAATSAITSVNANTFKTAFTQALATAGGNTSAFAAQVQSATPLSTPTVGISGYTQCNSGAACYFNHYAVNEHYKIHRASHTPAFSSSDCSSACTADASCEAFEYLTSPNSPACSFWMKGACNILAGSPPGYVTGISYATFCEKVGARSAFTAVTSNCKNSNILGLGSVLTAFLAWHDVMSFQRVHALLSTPAERLSRKGSRLQSPHVWS